MFIFLFWNIGCQSQPPFSTRNAVLLWSEDLSEDPGFKSRLQRDSTLLRPPTIDFLTDDQIIVAFDDDVVDPEPELKRFAFHVLEINTQSGHVGNNLSFPVTVDLSQVKIIKGGSFLVLEGEEILKFSRDFKQISSFPIPLQLHGKPTRQESGGVTFWNPRYETWQMAVAPGGETVLLEHSDRPMHMEFQWLKTNDFSQLQKMTSDVTRYISDAGNRNVLVNDPPQGSPFLLSPENRSYVCDKCGMAHMISENLFFIDGNNAYEIITANRKVLAKGKLEAGGVFVQRSMDSPRFVYTNGAYDGHGAPVQTDFPSVHNDFRVFDWKEMKQVANVVLRKKVGNVSSGYRQSAAALSPDGKFLAILDDSRLNCYRLP